MKKIFALLVVYSLVLIGAGCPSRTNVKQAFELSSQLSDYGKQATTAVGDLFEAKVISFEQKEKYVSALRKIQASGKIFNAKIEVLANIYKTKLPDEEITALDIFFNQEIIAPLAGILIDAANLSKENAQSVYLAIAVLKQAILFISNTFGKAKRQSVSFNFYLKEVQANA